MRQGKGPRPSTNLHASGKLNLTFLNCFSALRNMLAIYKLYKLINHVSIFFKYYKSIQLN